MCVATDAARHIAGDTSFIGRQSTVTERLMVQDHATLEDMACTAWTEAAAAVAVSQIASAPAREAPQAMFEDELLRIVPMPESQPDRISASCGPLAN